MKAEKPGTLYSRQPAGGAGTLERVLSESSRMAGEIAALNEVARQVNASEGLDQILDKIYDYLRTTFGISQLWLVLVDPVRNEFVAHSHAPGILSTPSFELFAAGFRAPIRPETGTLYATYSRRRVVHFRRMPRGTPAPVDQRILEHVSLVSFAQFPLIIQDNVIGIFCAARGSDSLKLSRCDADSIGRLCEHVAGAVRNAHLLVRMEQARKQAEQSAREIQAMSYFTRRINASTEDPDAILKQVLDYCSTNFGIQSLIVQLVDYEKNELYTYTTSYPESDPSIGEYSRSHRVPLDARGGILHTIYQHKRPFYMRRFRSKGLAPIDRQIIEGLNISGFLGVPLMVNGAVIGLALFTCSDKCMTLSRQDVLRISAFCDQIAGAVRTSQLLRETKAAREALAEADRQKTAFFQNVSHEIRTPLTLIAGPLETAQRRAEPLDTATLEMILMNTRRLQKLVNQLLDFQQVSAGKMTASGTTVDILKFLWDTSQAFIPYAEKHGIELLGDLPMTLPLVKFDVDHLEKCLYNYLSNALKFTPTEGRITIYARAFADDAKPHVRLEIRDTGPGIPADKVSRLFQRFGYSEGSLTKEHAGTGIGLSLVRQLVELNGGRVGVESKEGQGSTFWFTAPLSLDPAAVPDPAPPARAMWSLIHQDQSGEGPSSGVVRPPPGTRTLHRMLIVEDNRQLRDYMISIFAREGFEVFWASDGAEGLAQTKSKKPNIILTDLMMPRMSGIDMISEIRGLAGLRNIPIVLLTAKADESTRSEVRRAGADDYLAKPFSDMELISIVQNSLSLKARERELSRDLEHARVIQRELLPSFMPAAPGLDVAALYQPVEQVGGDLYDFVQFPDGSLGVFLADVSGHGIPAAMIASAAKIVLAMGGGRTTSPGSFLSMLNDQLYGRIGGNFLTCWYGIVSPDRASLRFASAGHPAIMLLRNKRHSFLKATGGCVAVRSLATYQDQTVALESRDRLFIYSDGLIEARCCKNGEMLEEHRLARRAEDTMELSLGVQLHELFQAGLDWCDFHPFEDDVTMVAIEVA
ncbi:MAG: SpoIIE family protein phosphatase [Spirochaetia bacterium]|nr:SpoIIE family protein phosphatase [Spirochaetia bacterium]